MTSRRILALLLSLMLVSFSVIGLAESADRVLTIDLASATDDELAEAASLIKAEQKARLKTAIQLSPAEVTVTKGATQKVDAAVAGLADGVTAGKFTWSSSDESVATCNNGTIKGIGAGSAVITCSTTRSDGTEISGDIKVTGLLPVTGIAFQDKKLEVMAGDVFKPQVNITPDNASDKTYTLSSSDEKIIRVDNDGQLVALLSGKATITVTSNDGSKKSAKLNVTVTKKVGKYDDELTFQGLEWGTDAVSAHKKLAEAGFVEDREYISTFNTNYMYHWPEQDLLFANWSAWDELPVAFGDQKKGAAELHISPLKKVGGYTPNSAGLSFLNSIGADGQVDENSTELCGVYFSFDNKHERGADIFVDLLSKMEAQYGEFTRYLAKDLTRRYYKDMYDVIKTSMEGAKQFTYRELGKDTFLSDCALCVLRGKNDTGIMLMISSSESVTLFYGKTDTIDRIEAIRKSLEAIPDDKEDAGI